MLTKGTIQQILTSTGRSYSPINSLELVTRRFAYVGKDVLDMIIWIRVQVCSTSGGHKPMQ